MDYPLISIIVPVYNVEKYLKRCVDSLINQTYSNIEIILVNDGSTDKSWDICQELESANANVVAVTKLNGGLSSARNYGLDFVKGQYVGFIDSDDWVEPDMYEYMYNLINTKKADSAQVKYELAYDNQHKITAHKEEINVLHGSDSILEYYMEQTTATGDYSVCICLFDAAKAKKFRFRIGKTSEDMDYKFNVLSECSCFVSSNQAKYHYFQAGESLSSGILIPQNFQLYESAEVLNQLCSAQSNKRTQFLGKVKKARTAFSLLSKAAFYGMSPDIDSQTIDALVVENRRYLAVLLKAPLPVSRKIIAASFAVNFSFAKGLISLYKRLSRGRI